MSERVFVIHGRDTRLYKYVLKVLEKIGVQPLTWGEATRGTGTTAPYTLDIVKYALTNAKTVLALMTPDEIVKLKTIHQDVNERDRGDCKLVEQARPNVIFETGLMMGLANEHQHVHVIMCNQCRSLSDIHGVHYISFDDLHIDAFLHTIIERLREDGLTIKEDAFELSKNVELPDPVDYSYLVAQEADEDSLAVVLTERGSYKKYYEQLLKASKVRIIGVSQGNILRHIRLAISEQGKDLKLLQKKDITILLAGNHYYTNMIDKIEDQRNRVLIDNNLDNALEIIKLKNTNKLNKLDLKMHLYANSCTIMIFDDVMWLTPYTHQGGSSSPTFIINKHENPKVYHFYQRYADRLCRDAVSVEATDVKSSLQEKLDNKRNELGLL